MEVVSDEVVEFFPHTFTSKAGKNVTVNKMTLKKFGPVSLGFTKPETLPFVEGDQVLVELEKKFGEWQYQGEAAAGSAPSASTPPPTAPKGGGKGFAMIPKTFPVPPTHGDMAIIHQNSLTNARAYVAEMVGHCIEPYFSMSQDKREDAVIELAYKFADFSSGADLLKRGSSE